jgi:hypothetical protein
MAVRWCTPSHQTFVSELLLCFHVLVKPRYLTVLVLHWLRSIVANGKRSLRIEVRPDVRQPTVMSRNTTSKFIDMILHSPDTSCHRINSYQANPALVAQDLPLIMQVSNHLDFAAEQGDLGLQLRYAKEAV